MSSPDVIEAWVTGEFEFVVRFADGTEGPVRLRRSFMSGVFEPLKQPDVFPQLTVADGCVQWPGDIDLAPDAMYEAIARDGVCTLE